MKIGFIGAGKVGCSLGKYFSTKGYKLTGYYSQTTASAKEAAQFTNSTFYSQTKDLITDSDILFLTVTDSAISSVWDSIKGDNLQGKIICHCSGSLSSQIFSDINSYGAYGYSIHPLYAIPSKTESYKDLCNAMFTLEGHPAHLDKLKGFLESFGNTVQIISTDSKSTYHAAAVFASNHMVALASVAIKLLADCGFSHENALKAISPLMEGNLANLLKDGPTKALTGPVERNDISTIKRHLDCITEDYTGLYALLTEELIRIAKEKHPDTDYSELEEQIHFLSDKTIT